MNLGGSCLLFQQQVKEKLQSYLCVPIMRSYPLAAPSRGVVSPEAASSLALGGFCF